MKVLTIAEAEGHLESLCDEARKGERVLLKRGEEVFELASLAGQLNDMDWEDPRFVSEMLRAVEGPYTPYSREAVHARHEAIRVRLQEEWAE